MVEKRALLIGVDEYTNLPDYPLYGCVSDVEVMHGVLTNRFGFDSANIKRLVNSGATRSSIVSAFDELLKVTDKGDIVYFHFSGHGSRRTPLHGTQLDSTIMPSDSGRGTDPNLDIADKEIYNWVRQLASCTPYITLVFDCCHSGTITRSPFVSRIRSIPDDARTLEEMGLRDSVDSLSYWEETSGFLPGDLSYTVLSGCRDNEYSNEYDRNENDTTIRNGALTYHLAETLLQAPSNATYRDVFDIVRRKVNGLYEHQHPQLEGARDRVFLGSQFESKTSQVCISSVKRKHATLDAGAVHGVISGSIWRPENNENSRLRVAGVEAVTSKVVVEAGDLPLVGDRCILLEESEKQSTLAIHLRSFVDPAFSQLIEKSRLLNESVDLEGADFIVENDNGKYAIRGRDQVVVGRLIDAAEASYRDTLMSNLESISKCRNLINLTNSSCDLKVTLNLYRSESGEEWHRIEDEIFEGDLLAFEIVNEEHRQVFVSLIDVGINGKISLFYPPQSTSDVMEPANAETGEPGILKLGFGEEGQQFQIGFPEGNHSDSGEETIKLFVTLEETDFSWLQQQGLRSTTNAEHPAQLAYLKAVSGFTTRDLFTSTPREWKTVTRTFTLKH